MNYKLACVNPVENFHLSMGLKTLQFQRNIVTTASARDTFQPS